MARLPLEGVRILDAYTWWQGPLASMFLAMMGAEVIKVESIQRYDGFRVLIVGRPQDPDFHEWSAAYNTCNHDKYDITLDLSRPKGREMFLELAKISDVVTESYRPGIMQKWGLGYEDVVKVKPDIIYSTGNYGKGPWGNYVGYGAPFGQIGGGAWYHGYTDRERPVGMGPLMFSDPINGFHSCFAILTALHHKKRTGKGQFLDLSQVEQQTGFYSNLIMDYVLNGRIARNQGNTHPSMAPHNIYQCEPGPIMEVALAATGTADVPTIKIPMEQWIAIAVSNDEEWQALVQEMGNPQWAQDPKFATQAGRYQHQAEIDKHISEWTKNFNHWQLMQRLQKAGVPAGAVATHADLLANEHFEERKIWKVVEREISGTHPFPDFPMKLSKVQPSIRWPSPTLGQHNEYIFKKYLGLTDKDLEELTAEDIIGTKPIWKPVI